MTSDNFWQFNIGSLIALVSAFSTFAGWLYFGVTWKTDVDRKMKIVWEMFVEPMMKKAFADRMITHNSPLRLDVATVKRHPVYDQIRRFYDTEGAALDNWDLLSQIKKRFGAELAAAAKAEGKTEDGFEIAALFLVRPEMELFKELNAEEAKNDHR